MELSIECLSKRFGSKIAVNNISVTLQPGVYGLLGANGAGKTTLMRMVCDVLKPTSGRILYNGKEIEQLGEHYRSYLGYLPQDFGYYPDFTAKEYLNFMYELKKVKLPRQKHIEDICRTVKIDHVYTRLIRNLSKGYKQRVGVAQALLGSTELLNLDEPTVGLDPKQNIGQKPHRYSIFPYPAGRPGDLRACYRYQRRQDHCGRYAGSSGPRHEQ